MHAFFQTLLSTQITLGTALPLLVMAALLVLVAAKAASRPPTPLGTVAKAQPTVLARGDAWLEKIGIGPFWRTAFWVLALAFAFLFIMAIMAAFVLIAGMIKSDTPTTSLGLGALLVALLGAPFLIWRTVVAQNTLDTARKEAKLKEESLFNDKINAAAKDLAARRQVTRVVAQDGKETIFTEWEDDLVTRAAAIDLLEGLANERPDAAPRIARQLSIYVRELSRQYPPKDIPTHLVGDDLFYWCKTLIPFRTDAERATQTLGRLHIVQDAALADSDIDLREANLQGFDLQGLAFPSAQMSFARLDGALLAETKFFRAELQHAKLTGAYLDRTIMDGSNLSFTSFEEAWLSETRLNAAEFWRTNLKARALVHVQMRGAILNQVTFPKDAVVLGPDVSGACMQSLSESDCEFLQPLFNSLFADITTVQRVPIAIRPAHWPTEEYAFQDELTDQWRAWAATLTPPVTIAPDYRDKEPT
jgi:uncharacterized protein YjbI with pentapeptide repeats